MSRQSDGLVLEKAKTTDATKARRCLKCRTLLDSELSGKPV